MKSNINNDSQINEHSREDITAKRERLQRAPNTIEEEDDDELISTPRNT
jgi:hypothetical protein